MNSLSLSRSLLPTAGLLAALVLAGCGQQPAATESTAAAPESAPALESIDQKVSYGVGRNIGMDVANNGDFEVDAAALIAGLRDGLDGADAQVSPADVQAAFMELQQRSQAAAAAASEENKAAALAFLEQNRTRPGVTVTPSGLQYEVLTAAPAGAAKPTPSNTVRVHYHGTLLDGTVFDSSVQRGQPIEFPVNGVIPGWVEALQLMPVGAKWKLFIPPSLGYGDRGTGSIPPGSALIFEVELLEIK